MKQNNFIVDQCGTLTPSSTKELVVTIHGTFSNEISCFLLTVSTNLFEHFSTLFGDVFKCRVIGPMFKLSLLSANTSQLMTTARRFSLW